MRSSHSNRGSVASAPVQPALCILRAGYGWLAIQSHPQASPPPSPMALASRTGCPREGKASPRPEPREDEKSSQGMSGNEVWRPPPPPPPPPPPYPPHPGPTVLLLLFLLCLPSLASASSFWSSSSVVSCLGRGRMLVVL
eukprot:4409104-Pyramimonas_sp.AAC.1